MNSGELAAGERFASGNPSQSSRFLIYLDAVSGQPNALALLVAINGQLQGAEVLLAGPGMGIGLFEVNSPDRVSRQRMSIVARLRLAKHHAFHLVLRCGFPLKRAYVKYCPDFLRKALWVTFMGIAAVGLMLKALLVAFVGIAGMGLMLVRSAPRRTGWARARSRLMGRMRQSEMIIPLYIGRNYLALLGQCRMAYQMIKLANPDVVILLEDNVGGLTRLVAVAARWRNVPLVVLPTTIPNPLEPWRFYSTLRRHQLVGLSARFVAWWRPAWVHRVEGQALLRLPPAEAIARELLGAARGNPWVLNTGEAARIFVDSSATRARYLAYGVSESTLDVTGDAFDDALRQAHKERRQRYQEICRALSWDADRLLLLCAFPPDQFSSPDVSRFEWSSFADLVNSWFAILRSVTPDMNVLVRPHPRLDMARLRLLEGGSVRLTTENTSMTIPLCSVYLACISATIRVALGLGKHVVNYDTYRYDYRDFDGAPRLKTVFDADQCRSALDRARRAALAPEEPPSALWSIPEGPFAPKFIGALQAVSARSCRTGRA